MSGFYLPRRQVQMSKPIVFWYQKKTDFIMCPPSPIAPPPKGFIKIECRHAVDVDIWSRRLRRQEKRIREMTDIERFEYEGKIKSEIIEEMKRCLANSTDSVNKQFMAAAIRMAEEQREKRRMEVVETWMACEAKEGVAS
jgi:hypothetical protein